MVKPSFGRIAGSSRGANFAHGSLIGVATKPERSTSIVRTHQHTCLRGTAASLKVLYFFLKKKNGTAGPIEKGSSQPAGQRDDHQYQEHSINC